MREKKICEVYYEVSKQFVVFETCPISADEAKGMSGRVFLTEKFDFSSSFLPVRYFFSLFPGAIIVNLECCLLVHQHNPPSYLKKARRR